MRIPGPDHLSYSRVRAFQNCGLAYYFKYVSKAPPEFTPAALAFGSAFHRAVEEALVHRMADVEVHLDEIVRVFESSLDESEASCPIKWGDREDRTSAVDQARRMLSAWVAAEPPPGRILAVEQQLELDLAPWLPKLRGKADAVLESEEHVTIMDLKTSRRAGPTGDRTRSRPVAICCCCTLPACATS